VIDFRSDLFEDPPLGSVAGHHFCVSLKLSRPGFDGLPVVVRGRCVFFEGDEDVALGGGVSLEQNFDLVINIDLMGDFDQSADPTSYSVQLQVRTTNDDPADAATWSEWMNFVVGDYTARAFQCRILLNSFQAGVSPLVSELFVNIDMPDRTDAQKNLISAPTGSDISFLYAFKETPVIGVTSGDMETGDRFAITDRTPSSFRIRFFDGTGAGVTRTFDYIAKGYGKT
jgi:hypothetical protein